MVYRPIARWQHYTGRIALPIEGNQTRFCNPKCVKVPLEQKKCIGWFMVAKPNFSENARSSFGAVKLGYATNVPC